MSTIILVVLLLPLLLFSKVFIRNNLLKKITLTLNIWHSIILLVSSLNLFRLNSVSYKIYLYWIIHLYLFTFTIILTSKIIKNKWNPLTLGKKIEQKLDKIIHSKIIIVICLTTLIGLTLFLIRYNILLGKTGLVDARNIRFATLFNSGIEIFIYNYILTAILRTMMLISAILIVKDKHNTLFFYICILCIIVYSMTGYGRMCIFEFITYIITTKILISEKVVSFKKIIKASTIGFFIFLLISTVTYVRILGYSNPSFANYYKYGIEKTANQSISYFLVGFRLFDHYLEDNISEERHFGELTLAGIEDILYIPIRAIGIKHESINDKIGKYTQQTRIVGKNGQESNAFYTSMFNYYGDFGTFGIMLYAIINGLLLVLGVKLLIDSNKINALLLIVFFSSILACSIYRWNLQFGTYAIMPIIMKILIGEKKG